MKRQFEYNCPTDSMTESWYQVIIIYEMRQAISYWTEEYDVESSNEVKEDNSDGAVGEIVFTGKKFVTTGLSLKDEEWVKGEVESRGGEFKPKFVV